MILTVKKDCDRNELQRLMNQLEKKAWSSISAKARIISS